MIYTALESRADEDIQVKVSYMEIYQEIGYDLLTTAARSSSVVHFPKVGTGETVSFFSTISPVNSYTSHAQTSCPALPPIRGTEQVYVALPW